MRVYSSIFYILSNFHTLSSESMYYILYLTSCIQSSMVKSNMLYSILYLISTIFNIVYVHSIYRMYQKFGVGASARTASEGMATISDLYSMWDSDAQ